MTFDRRTSIPWAPRGRCRGCGGEVPKRRRTWCSDRCVVNAQIRAGDPQIVRRELEKRDAGVCARCEIHTRPIERAIRHLEAWRELEADRLERRAAALFLYRATTGRQHLSSHLWEADHVTPVVEGGGNCGLEGYRTLCLRCHRAVTAELAARRARERRDLKAKTRLAAWTGRSE